MGVPASRSSHRVQVPWESYWVEPGSRQPYPAAYRAYRRIREAEERPLPRHRVLSPDVEHDAWRRIHGPALPPVEVRLTFRPGAPPRVRRIVAEVLRAIRRGRPAGDAIRHVARRFGLRQTRARAFIAACVGFELRPPDDARAVPVIGPQSPVSSLGVWS